MQGTSVILNQTELRLCTARLHITPLHSPVSYKANVNLTNFLPVIFIFTNFSSMLLIFFLFFFFNTIQGYFTVSESKCISFGCPQTSGRSGNHLWIQGHRQGLPKWTPSYGVCSMQSTPLVPNWHWEQLPPALRLLHAVTKCVPIWMPSAPRPCPVLLQTSKFIQLFKKGSRKAGTPEDKQFTTWPTLQKSALISFPCLQFYQHRDLMEISLLKNF